METESGVPDTLNSCVLSKSVTLAQDSNTGNGIEHGPLFFNYHEFAQGYYVDAESASGLKEHDSDHNICVTHFPNVYVAESSLEFRSTRIVRIPRRFDQTLSSPCFSTCLPGLEPAAILSDEDEQRFVPHGYYDNDQLFGYSSVSPLSQYLTQAEFESIMTSINEYLRVIYGTYSWCNLLGLALDIITLGVWSIVARRLFEEPAVRLEKFIAEMNNSPTFQDHKIKIISPRRSGYLSVCIQLVYCFIRSILLTSSLILVQLDFQIPKPSLS